MKKRIINTVMSIYWQSDANSRRRIDQRFWSKVEIPMDSNQCWWWTPTKDINYYGQFRISSAIIRPHNFIYNMIKGPILDDLEVDHLCMNKACVNPAHLDLVTHKENCERKLYARFSK